MGTNEHVLLSTGPLGAKNILKSKYFNTKSYFREINIFG
jgi:hypothetical protein